MQKLNKKKLNTSVIPEFPLFLDFFLVYTEIFKFPDCNTRIYHNYETSGISA